MQNSTQTEVALLKCTGYEEPALGEKIRALVDSLGGIKKFVNPGEKVLLKPNVLTAAKPEQAVTTHPAVVKAVAEMVIEAGAKPFIADSPALGNFKKALKTTGLGRVAAELDIPIFELGESVEYKQDEKKIYRILEISRHALDADRIINLPKLKTHTQMFMTLGVKNIFGCIVGKRKGQWHFSAGMDRLFFARMIVELYSAVSPDLTILDGVLGMEGNGPGTGGRPRQCDILMASPDAVALDRVVLEIIGAQPQRVFTNSVAAEYGVGETELSNIKVVGDSMEECRVEGFEFPTSDQEMIPLPAFLRNMLTDQLTSKPLEDRKKCTLCDLCIDVCPTDVISIGNKRLAINYDKCIRCYCCVEVCPEGAMEPHTPWLLRLIG